MVDDLGATKAARRSSILLLLHLSAVFDTVNHQDLDATLSDLGNYTNRPFLVHLL